MKTKAVVLERKPDVGNPHIWFDEGVVASAKPGRGFLLSSRLCRFAATCFALVVSLSGFASGENLIPNWSFEGGDTTQLHATYKYAGFTSLPGEWKGVSSGWAQKGAWYGINAKDGSAAAFMQNVSSISNVFDAPYCGEYRVSYWVVARKNTMNNLPITTWIDDRVVIEETKIADASKWIEMTVDVSLDAGSHVFAVTSDNTVGDKGVAIDLVSVTALNPISEKLAITSTGMLFGPVSPAYGGADFATLGDNFTCTAPQTALIGHHKGTCTGWKLYTWSESDGGWSQSDSGTGTSFAYTRTLGATQKLEWQWEVTDALLPCYQSELTVGGYVGTTLLENFPVLVRISESRIEGFSYGQVSSKDDLSFTDLDGNLLPYEVDTWNPEGESCVWVCVPKLSGKTTKLLMRWRHAKSVPNDPTAVWSRYCGVWHLGAPNADGKYADSTGHGLDATNSASANSCHVSAAKVGDGRWQPKIQLCIPSYDDWKLGGEFVASGWYYMEERTTYETFFNRKLVYNAGKGFCCNMQAHNAKFLVTGNDAKLAYPVFKTSVVGRWIHFVLVYNGTTVTSYDNGEKVADTSIVRVEDNGLPLAVGSAIRGTFDEVRLGRGVRTADWVKADFDTVNSANFVTAGAAESLVSDDMLRVGGEPEVGTVDPAYGAATGFAAGDTKVCTAPEWVNVPDATARYHLTGWTLEKSDGTTGEKTAVASWPENPGAGDVLTTCNYTHDGNAELTWFWQLRDVLGVGTPAKTAAESGTVALAVPVTGIGYTAASAALKVRYGFAPNALVYEQAADAVVTDVGTANVSVGGLVGGTTWYFQAVLDNGAEPPVESSVAAIYLPLGTDEEPLPFETDPDIPHITLAGADGSGADTLILTGELGAFTGSSCRLTAYTGDAPETCTNAWGESTVYLSASGEFEIVLFEPDAAASRYLTPGSTVFAVVEATANGKVSRSTTLSATLASGSATFKSASAAANTAADKGNEVTVTAQLNSIGANPPAQATLWMRPKEPKTGESADFACVAGPLEVADTAAFKLTVTMPDYGRAYQWYVVVTNASEGGTAGWSRSTSTNTVTTVNNVTYVWQAKDGEWDGNWSDAGHWKTAAGAHADAIPSNSSAIAKFPLGHAAVVTVDGKYPVGTLNFTDFTPDPAVPPMDVVIRGRDGADGGTNDCLTATSLSANVAKGRIAFDNVSLRLTNSFTPGQGRTVSFRNGAYYYGGGFSNGSGGTLEIASGAYADFAASSQAGAESTFILDDATVNFRGTWQICVHNVTKDSGVFYFRGKAPRMTFAKDATVYFDSNTGNTMTFDFMVPAGGYAVAPVSNPGATKTFIQYYNQNKLKLNVNAASPCFSQVATFDTPLVAWGGTGEVSKDTAHNTFGTLPDGGYFVYGTSATADYGWAPVTGFTAAAHAVGAHIVAAAHDDRLVVEKDVAAAVTGFVPTLGTQNQADVVAEGKIAFSAPVSQVVSGTRYTLTGYALAEITKTAAGEATNLIEGATASFDYTPVGKEVRLTWKYRGDVGFTVGTTAGGSIATNAIGRADDPYQTIGASATVTAVAADGYRFLGWYGDLAEDEQYDATLTVVSDKAKTVTAVFVSDDEDEPTWIGGTSGSWLDASKWSTGKVPGPKSAVTIAVNKAAVSTKAGLVYRVKSLNVSSGASLSLTPEGSFNTFNTSPKSASAVMPPPEFHDVGLVASGDITVGGSLTLGRRNSLADVKLEAGGDMTVTADASVTVYGGYNYLLSTSSPAHWREFGAIVCATGALTVAGTVSLQGDGYCGSPCLVTAGAITNLSTGAIHSDGGGWFSYEAPGSPGAGTYAGGSYGGKGGLGSNGGHASNAAFGNAMNPFMPGCVGGNNNGNNRGGGCLHVEAGTIVNDGRISADGIAANGTCGAGSGGAIWIVCDALEVTRAESKIRAKGGDSSSGQGGGGGGRIIVLVGLSDEQFASVYASGVIAPDDPVYLLSSVTSANAGDFYCGTLSAAGGNSSSSVGKGVEGSCRVALNVAGKAILKVEGSPVNVGTVEPAYGTQTYKTGDVVSFVGPEDAYISSDNRSRRNCAGYTIVNEQGVVLKSGTERSGSFTIEENCTLTWNLEGTSHRVTVEAAAGGSVATNAISQADEVWQTGGAALNLVATPADGYEFAGWYGETPPDLVRNATLSFAVDRARDLKAMFVSSDAGAVAWTGEGDGTSWFDGANWSTGKVPGSQSDVTVDPAKSVTISSSLCVPVKVKSLFVGAKATVKVLPNGSYSTASKPDIANQSKETDFQRNWVEVAGDLAVAGGFVVGAANTLSLSEVTVGGKLAFLVGATGTFYAGYTTHPDYLFKHTTYPATALEGFAPYLDGCKVRVGGLFGIASNAVVTTACDGLSGATPRFDVGKFVLSEKGTLTADAKSFFYPSYNNSSWGFYPVRGNLGGYAGGSYGGVGGYGSNSGHNPGGTYGWANAPFLPGGQSMNESGSPTSANGGGAIRLHVRGSARCFGTMTANGGKSGNYSGSGGAIFFTFGRLETTTNAVFTAKGGTGGSAQGSGGGGRIAFARRLTAEQLEELYLTGTNAAKQVKFVDPNATATTEKYKWVGTVFPEGFKARCTVDGGSYDSGNDLRRYGTPGTIRWIEGEVPGFLLLVR